MANYTNIVIAPDPPNFFPDQEFWHQRQAVVTSIGTLVSKFGHDRMPNSRLRCAETCIIAIAWPPLTIYLRPLWFTTPMQTIPGVGNLALITKYISRKAAKKWFGEIGTTRLAFCNADSVSIVIDTTTKLTSLTWTEQDAGNNIVSKNSAVNVSFI